MTITYQGGAGVEKYLIFSPHTLSRVLLTLSQTRTQHVLSVPRSAPFWRAPSSLRQSGQRHASFPRHRDRWVLHPDEKPSSFCSLGTQPSRNLLPLLSGFGGNSRRSRTTALFAREFWAGNLAASPSIPRGMSPHGARWLWVVVGEVAL